MDVPRLGRRPRHTAAAVASLVLVGALVVAWRGAHSSTHGGSLPVAGVAAMTAPAGMRWVGAGDVILAVPAAWAASQYTCESDPRPSVVYDAGYWDLCQSTAAGRRLRPASLWVLPTRHARRGFGGEALVRARHDVPGLRARRSDPWTERGDDGRYWYQSLVVPSVHTLFVAQATSRSLVEQVIASARRTPDGVVVPPATAGRPVADARRALRGYDVRVREVAGDYRAGSVVGSDPAFGTPLRRGETIVLSVSRGLGPEQAMSDAFLAHNGVHVEPLGTVSAADRARAARSRASITRRLLAGTSPWDTQLVLRRITSDEPRYHGVREIRHRLVWLALTPHEVVAPIGGGPCCDHASPSASLGHDISVYDALTGAFLWGESF